MLHYDYVELKRECICAQRGFVLSFFCVSMASVMESPMQFLNHVGLTWMKKMKCHLVNHKQRSQGKKNKHILLWNHSILAPWP